MSSKRELLRGHTGREKGCGWKGCKCSMLASEIPKLKKKGGRFEASLTSSIRNDFYNSNENHNPGRKGLGLLRLKPFCLKVFRH